MFYDRGQHHEFVSVVKELEPALGELNKDMVYPFEFAGVEKQCVLPPAPDTFLFIALRFVRVAHTLHPSCAETSHLPLFLRMLIAVTCLLGGFASSPRVLYL